MKLLKLFNVRAELRRLFDEVLADRLVMYGLLETKPEQAERIIKDTIFTMQRYAIAFQDMEHEQLHMVCMTVLRFRAAGKIEYKKMAGNNISESFLMQQIKNVSPEQLLSAIVDLGIAERCLLTLYFVFGFDEKVCRKLLQLSKEQWKEQLYYSIGALLMNLEKE